MDDNNLENNEVEKNEVENLEEIKNEVENLEEIKNEVEKTEEVKKSLTKMDNSHIEEKKVVGFKKTRILFAAIALIVVGSLIFIAYKQKASAETLVKIAFYKTGTTINRSVRKDLKEEVSKLFKNSFKSGSVQKMYIDKNSEIIPELYSVLFNKMEIVDNKKDKILSGKVFSSDGSENLGIYISNEENVVQLVDEYYNLGSKNFGINFKNYTASLDEINISLDGLESDFELSYDKIQETPTTDKINKRKSFAMKENIDEFLEKAVYTDPVEKILILNGKEIKTKDVEAIHKKEDLKKLIEDITEAYTPKFKNKIFNEENNLEENNLGFNVETDIKIIYTIYKNKIISVKINPIDVGEDVYIIITTNNIKNYFEDLVFEFIQGEEKVSANFLNAPEKTSIVIQDHNFEDESLTIEYVKANEEDFYISLIDNSLFDYKIEGKIKTESESIDFSLDNLIDNLNPERKILIGLKYELRKFEEDKKIEVPNASKNLFETEINEEFLKMIYKLAEKLYA